MELSIDIITYLSEKYLDDKDKVNLLMTIPKYYKLRFNLTFNSLVSYDWISYLDYYDRFTNLYIFNFDMKLPECIHKIIFDDDFNQSIKDCIPNSVTHLSFGSCFNQPIKCCIPNSVTHLTFGKHFNKPIEGCIPNSVTHLTFGFYFNQPIEGYIPNSVSHLILSEYYKYRLPK